jgi:hypothetical protein
MGGRQLLFGVTDTTNNPQQERRIKMATKEGKKSEKSKKNIKVKVHDLQPRKDAKGGVGPASPQLARSKKERPTVATRDELAFDAT